MTTIVFFNLTLTAILTVWSPGPNNILLLSSASKYGFRKNLPFLLGIWTGSFSLMLLCGFFCQALSSLIPGIQPIMKYIGGCYLLYLAYKTFRRLPPGETSSDQELRYSTGVFLQLINVKIIIYGLTMFSSFILPYIHNIVLLIIFAFYLMLLGAIGNLIWAFAGNVLKSFYTNHYRLMNFIMSLLLVWCSLRVMDFL